jgi:predicted enzyme related to lactoylglutathione lyase
VGDPVMQWQIVSKQPEAHAGFYSAVFGWNVRSDNPMGYLIASTGSERGISGGFWPAPPEASAFVQLFMEVGDVTATIELVTRHGGSVLIPPQTLPEGDQMAILRDPVGITFGVVAKAKR